MEYIARDGSVSLSCNILLSSPSDPKIGLFIYPSILGGPHIFFLLLKALLMVSFACILTGKKNSIFKKYIGLMVADN